MQDTIVAAIKVLAENAEKVKAQENEIKELTEIAKNTKQRKNEKYYDLIDSIKTKKQEMKNAVRWIFHSQRSKNLIICPLPKKILSQTVHENSPVLPPFSF